MFSWLKASPSLLLEYDITLSSDAEKAIEEITEVRRYYRFISLKDLFIGKKPQEQVACLLLRRARKGAYLYLVPELLGGKIPFTVFVNADFVGTNRLPFEEEIRGLVSTHQHTQDTNQAMALLESFWDQPEDSDQKLGRLKKEWGPAPFSTYIPEQFGVTWGELIKNANPLQNIEWDLSASPSSCLQQVDFIKRQLKCELKYVRCDRKILSEKEKATLIKAGMVGCVTNERGMIKKKTEPWRLPLWHLEKSG